MTFNNEAEVLKALGIPNWGALTLDLLPKLATMVPAMDKDLAALILPKLSADSVQGSTEVIRAALASNDRNQERLHDIDMATLNPLASAYSQAATPEEREEHWQRMGDLRRDKYAKDTEEKDFKFKLAMVAIAATTVALLATFVAARTTASVVK